MIVSARCRFTVETAGFIKTLSQSRGGDSLPLSLLDTSAPQDCAGEIRFARMTAECSQPWAALPQRKHQGGGVPPSAKLPFNPPPPPRLAFLPTDVVLQNAPPISVFDICENPKGMRIARKRHSILRRRVIFVFLFTIQLQETKGGITEAGV